MKVLHVFERFAGFGVSQQLSALFDCFDHSLAQHSLCSIQSLDASVGYDFETSPAVSVHSLELRGRRCWAATFRWINLLRSLRPNIVHFWLESPPIWMIGASKMLSAKIYLSSEEQKSDVSLNRMKAQVFERAVDQIVLPCDRYGSDKLSRSKTSVSVAVKKPINRTIQPNRLFRQQFCRSIGLEQNAKLIVTVAELEPGSRLKDPIWATDLLKCIRDDVHFVVIGEGSQKDRLQKYAFQASVGEYVHLVGERGDAQQIVSCADVYWASDPTQLEPDGIRWAMSAGVPVIASDSNNHSRLIENGDAGILVRTGARDLYAREANQVLNHPEYATKRCEKAKQISRRWLNADDFAIEIEGCYGVCRSSRLAA